MTDPVTTIAYSAVLANAVAVCSGWGVLIRHPKLLSQTVGQSLNFSPSYVCYVVVVMTTALSMYLSFLLCLWFTMPGIHAVNQTIGEVFMFYHVLTGVVAATIHLLIALIAEVLLTGDHKDVDASAQRLSVAL